MNNNEMSKMYNTKDIMDLIESQMVGIMQNDYEYYKNYNIRLANEQYYVAPEDRKEPNIIYIVVKFLPADITFNQNVVPITITAVSEYNKLEVCQRLLLEYAQTYNLFDDIWDEKINYNQTYTTPQVMSNFNEVYYGYRNTLFMSGTFLLSYNFNPSKIYFLLEGEKILIDTISFSEDVTFQLDSQVFFNRKNFSSSETKFATRVINFSIYLTNEPLCNKILEILNEEEDIGYDFTFITEYKNGYKMEKKYKISNFVRSQDIGAMPIINVSFTN